MKSLQRAVPLALVARVGVRVEIWIPATNVVESDPLVIWGGTFSVRGQNFNPILPVQLSIDTVDGQQLGLVDAGSDGSFSTTLTWSSQLTGQHNILAYQLGAFSEPVIQVSVPIFAEEPPA